MPRRLLYGQTIAPSDISLSPGKVFQESLVPFLFVPTQAPAHELLSLPSLYTQMSGEKGNPLLNCSRGTAYKVGRNRQQDEMIDIDMTNEITAHF